ncbi:hypothetical protein SAMN03097699_0778 [Flavobacteriaceae bacterium MAR_2010_188]|nr:hypothetical protein SAMN03097699_0778 [Flavobacteriaceae bacterium MAR_2010_188]
MGPKEVFDLQFENDNSILFSSVFRERQEFKEYLYKEFLGTQKKPNIKLFLKDYFTDQEIIDGIESNDYYPKIVREGKKITNYEPVSPFEKKYLEKHKDYYDLIFGNKLDQKYFSHNISDTKIATILTDILGEKEDSDIKNLKEYLLVENNLESKLTFAESWSKGFLKKIKKIGYPYLENALINHFNDEYINLIIKSDYIADRVVGHGKHDVDTELKEYVKSYLLNALKSPDDTDNNDMYFEFNNEFDGLDPKIVYSHFYEGLVKPQFIDTKTLQEFFIQAFENECPPAKKFRMSLNGDKKNYRKVFYKYYKNIANSPHGKKPRYVKLLTDFFEDNEYNYIYRSFSTF